MSIIRMGCVAMVMAALVSSVWAQSDLDPAFRVINVAGDCKISLPGAKDFVAAEESKAYPYGSHIRTGARSSLVAVISEGNTVRVLANADVVFNHNTEDVKIKNIRLNDGEVEVDLKSTFHEGGNRLNVETATAICGAVGTQFNVGSRMVEDMRVVIARVVRGIIRVHGENFEVLEMDAEDIFSVTSPADQSYLRMKTMQGKFNVSFKDENMEDKHVETAKGTVLKVWQRFVPESNQRIIHVQLMGEDGVQIEEFIFTYGGGVAPGFGEGRGAQPQWDDEEKKPGWRDGRRPGQRGNPLPPDHILDGFVERTLNEENVEFDQQQPVDPLPPRPLPPTPTPAGRR